MRAYHLLLTLLVAIVLVTPARVIAAELQLASLFQDHVVLQREADVPVWGWSEPNDEISVEFAGQRVTAQTDTHGKWTVKLKPMRASATPQKLVVGS